MFAPGQDNLCTCGGNVCMEVLYGRPLGQVIDIAMNVVVDNGRIRMSGWVAQEALR